MKTSKKLLSLLLVLAMVFALGCTAYASDAETADTAEPTEETGDTTTEAPAEGEEAPAEGEEAEEETPAEEEAPAEESSWFFPSKGPKSLSRSSSITVMATPGHSSSAVWRQRSMGLR